MDDHEFHMERPFLVSLNQRLETFTVVVITMRDVPGEEVGSDLPNVFLNGETAYVVEAASPEAAVHEAIRRTVNNRDPVHELVAVRVPCVFRGAVEVVPRSSIGVSKVANSLGLDQDEFDPGWYNLPQWSPDQG